MRSLGSTVQRWGQAFTTCTSSTINRRFSNCHTNLSRVLKHTNAGHGTVDTVPLCDAKDALYSKMSHTHSFTATKSHYQRWCQADNMVPCVWMKPIMTQICVVPVYSTGYVLVKDLPTPYTLFCELSATDYAQQDGEFPDWHREKRV